MGTRSPEQLLARVTAAGGLACVAIGIAHAVGGARSIPGGKDANATLDSQERFYGPVFAAWGLLLMRAGREPADLTGVDLLSASMLAGGGARLLSMADRGRPHPFYVALTVVEFAAPAAVLSLTRATRRRAVPS